MKCFSDAESPLKLKKLNLAPVIVDPSLGITILNKLCVKNIGILIAASGLQGEVGSTFQEIFSYQDDLISELRMMINSAKRDGIPLHGYDLFKRVDSMREAISAAYPLFATLPQQILDLVLELDELIFELRLCYLKASRTTPDIPPALPLAEVAADQALGE